jgi:hypothetical protein
MIAKACDALSDGSAKTITEAADIAGCHRVYLSKSLRRAHVRQYLLEKANLGLLAAAPAAAKIKVELMHGAKSEVVKSDCATEVLALAGIQVARAPAAVAAVQVNVGCAGYVLTGDDDMPGELPPGPGYVIDLRGASRRSQQEAEPAEAPTVDAEEP